ncbi:hypothetical protein BXZ70DRAFT_1079883 [Cristinia sonorae]|uniref:Fungal-type protein kinase domain-containing protein n=1 Tax=Cristinia sonorae TaxID=1940300 RepID=A0A8K0UIZ4_9AGAR|nr:hypothetical protein BXZ70DRAFT_1079883 [Cristinia sonorae]
MLSFLPDHLLYSLPPLHYYPPHRYYESDIDIDIDMPREKHTNSLATVYEDEAASGPQHTTLPTGAQSLDIIRPRPPNTPPPARGLLSESALPTTAVAKRLCYTSIYTNGSPQTTAVKEYLHALLADKITRNYDTVEFIEKVWGLPREELKEPEHGYKLPVDAVKHYMGATYKKRDTDDGPVYPSVERSAYEPLSEMFWSISEQVGAAYCDRLPGPQAVFVLMRDHILNGHFANLKPDFLFSLLAAFERQSWLLTALCGELKKSRTSKPATMIVESVDIKKIVNLPRRVRKSNPETPQSSSTPPAVVTETEGPSASVGGKRKAQSMVSHEPPPAAKKSRSRGNDDPSPAPVQPRPNKIRSMKRKDGTLPSYPSPTPSVSTSSVSTSIKKKSSKGNTITPDELQIIKYINELGSHGIRSYATGFLIVDYDITLWYIDRMGVVSSSSFNFIEEPHLFVYFVAAVTRAGASSLGFSSLLKFPDPSPELRLPAQTFTQYKDVKMVLPTARDIHGNVFENLDFSIDVEAKGKSTRRIVPTYGAVGRATIVIPVVASTVTATKIRVCPSEAPKLVAKVSWQVEDRDGEDEIIREIHEKLTADESRKKFLQNIVSLKLSTTRTMEEMELPRAKMFGLSEPHRVCRILVMHEYLPLTAVENVSEFKKVFSDVLAGHHAVYETSNVIHRDVSINNIMFYYDKIGNRKKNDSTETMCDWDLARKIPPPGNEVIRNNLLEAIRAEREFPKDHVRGTPGEAKPTFQQPSGIVVGAEAEKGLRYRTGTGPFIALDILLYNKAPVHLYRHDLESFFWVLVWFVATFDPKSHSCGVIRTWLSNDLQSIGQSKRALLSNAVGWTNELYASTHPSFKKLTRSIQRLRVSLIYPLYEQYCKAQDEYIAAVDTVEAGDPSEDEDEDEDEDDSCWKTQKTNAVKGSDEVWEDLQERMGAVVTFRESILTYESFLKCLHIGLITLAGVEPVSFSLLAFVRLLPNLIHRMVQSATTAKIEWLGYMEKSARSGY